MRPGALVDGRFYLERQAGAGGMGTVFRAVDRREGGVVALKILRGCDDVEVERFLREAAILADLDHPNIVRYATHGLTETGEHYLAMEWLEGEDLGARIARKPLADAESLAIVGQAAAAIGFAHARGAVHRDVKPSNIFLRDHEVGRVAVLDFGIAAMLDAPHKLTQTGVLLGTPGYVAPEQVQGGTVSSDPRSDIFSLGCVLFECLVGYAAFQGQTPMAVLAKLMLQEPPRPGDHRPGIPPALDALVARMLAKDPTERPQGLDEVTAELALLAAAGPACSRGAPASPRAITLVSAAELPPASDRTPSLTRNEMRLVTVVLAGDPRGAVKRATGTLPPPLPAGLAADLSAAIAPHGGRLTPLADGSLIVTVWAPGTPVDRAERAALSALAVRARFPDLSIAMVTGRGQAASRLVDGDTIDRAARALAGARAGVVHIDQASAGMLAARFAVERDGAAWALRVPAAGHAPSVRPLDRTVPFVGRSRELAMLEGVFAGCVADPMASAVIITGAAGTGKSRLCVELCDKLRRAGEPLEVLAGRADALVGGTAFGAVADVIRNAAGLRGADPPEVCREKLRARLGRHLRGPMLERITSLLGEMIGLPMPDGSDAVLVAARANPLLMGDAMRAGWEEWLIAEARAQPVILVLEDLHWGDGATARLVDTTLRDLRDLPLMVVGLARVESQGDAIPGWIKRDTPAVKLGPLPARACERLVRDLLGGDATEPVVDRLLERSGGNPFYLCELIHAVAAGRGDALPDSVLGLVEARLDAEGADAKRVLRAASVFGDRFGAAGVAALLGGDRSAASEVRRALAALSSRELVLPVGDEGPGSSEFVFSHALVREAAYAMLTDADRSTGHLLAGVFLEQTGNPDALAMAEHFQRGGATDRAARWYRRAAEKALEANDLPAAVTRAERGVTLGAEPEDRGALRLVQVEAHLWLGELSAAVARGREAVDLLPRGSALWYRALQNLAGATAKLGGVDPLVALAEAAVAAAPAPDAAIPRLVCLAEHAKQLVLAGRHAAAAALAAAIDGAVNADAASIDPLTGAEISHLYAIRALHGGDLVAAREHFAGALAGFDRAGDQRHAARVRANLGFVLGELGDLVAAEASLRAALSQARRLELGNVVALALHNLGLVLAHRAALDEARQAELDALEAFREMKNPRMEGMSHAYLARILLLSGDSAAAEREARAAVALLQVSPPFRAAAFAVRAQALLGLGRDAEALAAARAASGLLASLGALPEGESLVRIVLAEALGQSADPGAAEERRAVLAQARERLLARAARIGDPAQRVLFLRAVPCNARTLELSGAVG